MSKKRGATSMANMNEIPMPEMYPRKEIFYAHLPYHYAFFDGSGSILKVIEEYEYDVDDLIIKELVNPLLGAYGIQIKEFNIPDEIYDELLDRTDDFADATEPVRLFVKPYLEDLLKNDRI